MVNGVTSSFKVLYMYLYIYTCLSSKNNLRTKLKYSPRCITCNQPSSLRREATNISRIQAQIPKQ